MQIPSKSLWLTMFNDVISAAVKSEENINSDGSINWNFVEADVFLNLDDESGAIPLDEICEQFDKSADEFLAQ